MNIIVLISAYKPDYHLEIFIDELKKRGISKILIVDDGSGDEYCNIFDSAEKMGADVLSLAQNNGKGYAIKAGLIEIAKSHPGISGVVTADSDGQHSAEDVKKAAELLLNNPGSVILGERNMKDKNVPGKFRHRNSFISFVCRMDTGKTFLDSQTGLRGIPSEFIPLALNTEGNRFEYESNFLADITKKNIPVVSFEIEALFPSDNKTYYKSFEDSIRIISRQLRFTVSSLSCSAIDILLFSLFKGLFNTRYHHHVFISGIMARIVSGTLNFVINKKVIFKDNGAFRKQFSKYLLFFFFQMFLSSGLVSLFAPLKIHLEIVKICVDSILFVLNYFVQRRWIFR